ncbi:GNAT family acetyltransferase [Herbiconiux solani]|uniref:GNAT family acetyltransferase n=1 Tax=Herbiconiux solani TaxID=661329 RepID=UPI000A5F59BC|nr:GNAT family acetyltransferase [Herbiconiux solani]
MPRTRDLPEQQRLLSEATWSVLTERGLPGLTIRAVAERAGCTTGLVMHAFPTKEALLLHARDLLHSRTGRRADAAEESAPDPEAALEAVLLNAMSLDAASADEARVWVSFLAASLVDPALAERHTTGNRSFVARITRLLTAARPGWPEGRARDEALALIALAEGMNSLSAADPETYSPEAQRRAMTDALRRALDAVPAPEAVTTVAGAAESAAAVAGTTEGAASGGSRIRRYLPGDEDSVVALWAEVGLTRPWNDPRKDIARKLTVQPELFLVIEAAAEADELVEEPAKDANRVIATVMAGFDGHRGWVNYLAVDPAHRGAGHARTLMSAVEDELTRRGCPKINLQIREGNEGVMAFYRALGYERDAAVSFGKRLIPDA